MSLVQGQVLQNRYRVVKPLGQGGFGAVYRAWDMNLNKPVALKENLDTSSEAQRQFLHEAQILSNLSHPNLPRVTDHFLIPGMGQYLVMDYIEGENLQAMLDRTGHPLPEAQVLPWIDQVCDALIYLHTQTPPVIHRDIKPANIKITPQGRAMLVDFGIAKIYDPAVKTTKGAQGVTPPYSPPEQYGKGTTDARSDIYALGATMYILLTGQEPPDSVERVANNVKLTSPRQLESSISPSVEAVILRACETAKVNRFQNISELKRVLRSASLKSYMTSGALQTHDMNLKAYGCLWLGAPVLLLVGVTILMVFRIISPMVALVLFGLIVIALLSGLMITRRGTL